MRCLPTSLRATSGRFPVGPARALVLVLALATAAAPAWGGPSNDRQAWLVGVGFLLGDAEITGSTGFDSGWVTGVTPEIRLGYMAIDQRLMVGIENKQWTREQGNLPTTAPPPGADFVKYQVGSQVFSLVFTGFPGDPETALGGLYFRVGAGPAVARLDSAVVDTLFTGEDPVETVEYEWGWGGFAGGGYEYRFLPNVAAGLSVDYVYSSIKGSYVDRTKILTFAFNLNWYF